MRLTEHLEREGDFLFRWRSFLPLALVPAALPALYADVGFDLLWGPTSDHAWVYLCMMFSLSGLVIRWVTVGFVPAGTSGRNTRAQRADALNTTGMYAVVRNPLYLGNFIAILGLALSTRAWWFVLLVALAYWLYIERIIAAEERFLAEKFGAAYDAWASNTPLFMPNFNRWRRPSETFSLRTVMRREYNGVLHVAASYFAIEVIVDLLMEGEIPSYWLHEDHVWIWFFVTSSVVFLTLRTLKKHTRLLRVPGR